MGCIIKEENEDVSKYCKLEPVDDFGPSESIRLREMPEMETIENRSCSVKTENCKLEPVDYHEPASESVEPGEAEEWHDSAGLSPVPVPFVRYKKRKHPSNSATCPKCNRSFVRTNGLKRHNCKQVPIYCMSKKS